MKKEIEISRIQIIRLRNALLLSIVSIFVIHHFGSFFGNGSPRTEKQSAYATPVYSANDLILWVGYSCPLNASHTIETEGGNLTWGDVFNFGDSFFSPFREMTYFYLIFDGHWFHLLLISIVYFLIFNFFSKYKFTLKR
jgi:hypothetical protein